MAITEDLAAVQLPSGIDHHRVRVTAARNIKGGDLLVGIDDGTLTHAAGLRSARPFPRARYALPQQRPAQFGNPGCIALDGQTYTAGPYDLVLYVPAAWCPVGYRPGQRVERIGWQLPEQAWQQPRRYAQRGTIRRVDDDGLVRVQWDGDEHQFLTPRDVIRPVDPADIDQERSETGGFATGDRVTFGPGPSAGLVLELYRPAFYGPFRARVLWDGTPPHEDTFTTDRLTVTEPTAA